MSKFKVGDKVRVIASSQLFGMPLLVGKVGIITKDDGTEHYQYRLDIDPNDNPWGEHWLELVEQPRREFIVIHRDGNVMTAEHRVNREVVKSAKATCNPSDVFNFDAGAKLAFDRLMGREEPQPEPKPAHRFKVGDRILHEQYGLGTIIGYVDYFSSVPYKVRPDDVHCLVTCWSEERVAPAPEPPKYVPHIGDRVVTEHGNGTVMAIKGKPPILVLHDNWKLGHDAGATCPDFNFSGSRCWWFYANEIKPLTGESNVR